VLEIKPSLYLLNSLTDVTSDQCPSLWLCARAQTSNVAAMAGHWQHVRDLIGSRFEPHTSCTRSNCHTTCGVMKFVRRKSERIGKLSGGGMKMNAIARKKEGLKKLCRLS